jgi:hypothetical protein
MDSGLLRHGISGTTGFTPFVVVVGGKYFFAGTGMPSF